MPYYENRKAREDYDRPVACNECGSTTGEFYRDTDDNDIICLDCLMGLPGESEKEYRDALDHSNNYEEHVTSTGRVTIRCVFCLEEVATLTQDDIYEGSSDLDDVVALLEKDEPHDCETDEEEDEMLFDVEPRWMDADQKLIDATLDERLAQIMAVQRERIDIRYGDCNESLADNEAAWEHLNRDIALLQPHSSVPF